MGTPNFASAKLFNWGGGEGIKIGVDSKFVLLYTG
jgi:hypothetical protein